MIVGAATGLAVQTMSWQWEEKPALAWVLWRPDLDR
jgi:hypothetical protein